MSEEDFSQADLGEALARIARKKVAAADLYQPPAAKPVWPPEHWNPPAGSSKIREEPICPECQDRGWSVVADGGAGTAKPCPCRRETNRDQRLSGCQVPSKFRLCTLENFQTDRASEAAVRDSLVGAKAISTRWLNQLLRPEDDSLLNPDGLLFVGPPGNGKTHLATALLMEAIRRYGVSGIFVDFTTLLLRIHASYASGTPPVAELLAPYLRTEVLVIDELGAQKPTEHTMSILYLLLNGRYVTQATTLFTTNYRLDEDGDEQGLHATLSSRISTPLVSRLHEIARPVPVGGWDYRKEVQRFKVGL